MATFIVGSSSPWMRIRGFPIFYLHVVSSSVSGAVADFRNKVEGEVRVGGARTALCNYLFARFVHFIYYSKSKMIFFLLVHSSLINVKAFFLFFFFFLLL